MQAQAPARQSKPISNMTAYATAAWIGKAPCFLPQLPSHVTPAQPTTGFNLFTYLPAALLNYPGDVLGLPPSVAALAAVGFNPESQLKRVTSEGSDHPSHSQPPMHRDCALEPSAPSTATLRG